jgi:hypothetical protein
MYCSKFKPPINGNITAAIQFDKFRLEERQEANRALHECLEPSMSATSAWQQLREARASGELCY